MGYNCQKNKMKKILLTLVIALGMVSSFAGTLGCLSGEYDGERFCLNEYGKFIADVYNPEEGTLVRVEGRVVDIYGDPIELNPGDNVRVKFLLNKPLDGRKEFTGNIGWATNGQKFVNFGGIMFEN